MSFPADKRKKERKLRQAFWLADLDLSHQLPDHIRFTKEEVIQAAQHSQTMTRLRQTGDRISPISTGRGNSEPEIKL